MQLIKEFFKEIQRDDIDENATNLLSEGIIDSLDIMGLVNVIEKHFKKPLKAEFIEANNFESFQSIKAMIEKAMSD
ncbi:phosphopantetheine-binding protein [Campylobacter sp. LR286c]|uniref:phosphopantetheine-binding protein n=1 Tax=Campylobacter sp. LR286c TaxID=2593545 RepID=UPI00123834A1|nr:phosphopantetheine-binding protein [Campylobacter sp. LR286c]KAA6229102.1 acyl carrier protein [Campylobacter sp. LR286c]